jgi:YegS/Rv2252/BmrU family lipid kinase
LAGSALLLINRKSRNGDTDVDAGLACFRQAGMEVIDAGLEKPDQIPEAIRRHADHVDCIIVGGGDGSLNAAAPALVETGVPLGILPLGTANDLARTLAIPTDIEAAAQIIVSGVKHHIDVGSVNGHYFFNVANIGLGVQVTHQLSPDLKQRWGVICYARSLASAFKSFDPFHAEIVCDGRHHRVRSIQIAVGNGRYYGGGMTVDDEASIDDHRFFLYSIEPLDFWNMLRLAPAVRSGTFEEHHPVHLEQGRTIEIVTRKPMVVTADGEIVTRTPARFTMHGSAVQVFVPPGYLHKYEETRNVAPKRTAARA